MSKFKWLKTKRRKGRDKPEEIKQINNLISKMIFLEGGGIPILRNLESYVLRSNAQSNFKDNCVELSGLEKIDLLVQENDYYEFSIVFDGIELRINCFLSIEKDLLVLKQIDIEGPGPGAMGRRFLTAKSLISKELCRMFKTRCVELHAAKRTTGRTIGKIPHSDRICLDLDNK